MRYYPYDAWLEAAAMQVVCTPIKPFPVATLATTAASLLSLVTMLLGPCQLQRLARAGHKFRPFSSVSSRSTVAKSSKLEGVDVRDLAKRAQIAVTEQEVGEAHGPNGFFLKDVH
jgi:hypothetical protein